MCYTYYEKNPSLRKSFLPGYRVSWKNPLISQTLSEYILALKEPRMHITPIRALVKDELQAVDDLIANALRSEVSIISDLGCYVVQGGGKRLRPLVLLLMSKSWQAPLQQATQLAAVIELLHTATLLHDDVVDNATSRRGRETANSRWGNEAAVLVGDFLYSKAFQMLLTIPNPSMMRIVADTTNIMAEGEALQLVQRCNTTVGEADYLRIISCKTAQLFGAAARLGGVLGQVDHATEEALRQYGLHLGTAFQLMDDLLDYDSIEKNTGKTLGNDFAEGKMTLPLIHLFKTGEKAEIEWIKTALEAGGYQHFSRVQAIVKHSGAIEYTKNLAKLEVEKAKAQLAPLPHSAYLTAAMHLADFAVERDH
jgi:octaprenyl-diphosphate synthase